ncbi:MAG: glycosyltransferase family 4 protein [Muribaculaceae bacterium]|nr:glycosyltransferase family 4 protein [Muribaculaceae bacterium]
MNILFITNTFSPFDLGSGGGQRSYFICKSLSELGSVDLIEINVNKIKRFELDYKFNRIYNLSLNNVPKIKSRFNILRRFSNFLQSLIKIDFFFKKNDEITVAVKDIIDIHKYDLIFARYLRTATLCNLLNKPNLIIDIDDNPIEASKINNRYFNYFVLGKIYQKNLCKFYRKVINNVPLTFISNKNQVESIKQYPLKNIPLITDFLTKDAVLNNSIHKPSLLFIGLLDYYANYKSLEIFIRETWPKLINRIPNLQFYIIGRGLPEYLKNLFATYNGINITGFVQDLEPYFKNCTIYVSPIYFGSGTNIKILEAMGKGIAIVGTPMSIRGYEDMLIDRVNILIAKNGQEFIDDIEILIRNKQYREDLVENAKETLIQYDYIYDSFSNNLHQAIRKEFPKLIFNNHLS